MVAWDLNLCEARRVGDRPESSAVVRYFRVEFVWLREGELLLVKHGRDVREVAVGTGRARSWADAPPRILGHLGGDVLAIAYDNRIEWLDYTRSKVLGSCGLDIGGGPWGAWGTAQATRLVRPGSWLVRGYDMRGMGDSVKPVEDLGELSWLAFTGQSVVGGPGDSPSNGGYHGPVKLVWGQPSAFLGRALNGADAVFGPERRLDHELLGIVRGRNVVVWAHARRANDQRGEVKEIELKGVAGNRCRFVFVDEKRVAVAVGSRISVYALDGDCRCVAEHECAGNIMSMSAGGTSSRIVVAYYLKGRVHLLCWNVGRG